MSRLPSIKTIAREFSYLSDEDVKKFRKILEDWAHRPIACLKKLNRLLCNYGIEYLEDRKDDQHNMYGIYFSNTGESYATTILYDMDKGRFFISSWGDVVEKNERRMKFLHN
jgi:hypothetical protein